jgi:hypothetical protein
VRSNVCMVAISKLQLNGKAVPLQAYSGPEGSRDLRFPDIVEL